MTRSQNLCQRLSAIGLRQDRVHSIVDQVSKWVSCSGQEWTVARLKDIKAFYVAQLAGTRWQPATWTKTANNRLKGPFGGLPFKSFKQIARTMNAVMVYSEFVSSEPTRKQLSKFIGSAQSAPDTLTSGGDVRKLLEVELRTQVLDNIKRASDVMVPGGLQGKTREKVPSPKLFTTFHWSTEKRAPLSKGGSVVETDMKWVQDNLTVALVNNSVSRYKSLSVASGLYQYAMQVKERNLSCPQAGKIAFIQEPGFKLRAIANPYRIFQILLDPLKRWSFGHLRELPRDCTYDQSKGVEQITAWLREKRTVHCLDLSDATNHFPLSVQMQYLMNHLDLTDTGTRESVQLFGEVSRSTWGLPSGSSLRFTRGQPLGLGPSFAIFAMTHYWILESLRKRFGGDFVMVGDDVAIIGDDFARHYREVMVEKLGVPISLAKSLSSSMAAEFAGKLITPEGVISTPKWRTVSDNSFLDVARLLGPQSVGLLRPRQRRVVRVLAEVPEFLGGLGWNPNGRPLEERIALGIDLGLWQEDTGEGPYRSLSATHNSVLAQIAYEYGLVWKQFHTVTHAPTRGVLDRVSALTGVVSGFAPLDLLGGDFDPGISPNSDPRGEELLGVLERKLASRLEERSPVRDRPA